MKAIKYPGESDILDKWKDLSLEELILEQKRVQKGQKLTSQLYNDFGIYEHCDAASAFDNILAALKKEISNRESDVEY